MTDGTNHWHNINKIYNVYVHQSTIIFEHPSHIALRFMSNTHVRFTVVKPAMCGDKQGVQCLQSCHLPTPTCSQPFHRSHRNLTPCELSARISVTCGRSRRWSSNSAFSSDCLNRTLKRSFILLLSEDEFVFINFWNLQFLFYLFILFCTSDPDILAAVSVFLT